MHVCLCNSKLRSGQSDSGCTYSSVVTVDVDGPTNEPDADTTTRAKHLVDETETPISKKIHFVYHLSETSPWVVGVWVSGTGDKLEVFTSDREQVTGWR